MAEFTLKSKKAKTLKVNIGEESFHIPLARYLKPSELTDVDLNTPEGTREFLRKYISKEAADDLTIADYDAITQAWIEASGKDTGE